MACFCLTSSDIQSPSVELVNATSISLHYNESIPLLRGNPNRNITQYLVKVSPRDGGDQQVVFVTPEVSAVVIVTGLNLLNTFDIGTEVVIDTEGQGEQTYDIGVPVITVTSATRKYSKYLSLILQNLAFECIFKPLNKLFLCCTIFEKCALLKTNFVL